jgi:hypothetical protein
MRKDVAPAFAWTSVQPLAIQWLAPPHHAPGELPFPQEGTLPGDLYEPHTFALNDWMFGFVKVK